MTAGGAPFGAPFFVWLQMWKSACCADGDAAAGGK
jgi:hypothetical protein